MQVCVRVRAHARAPLCACVRVLMCLPSCVHACMRACMHAHHFTLPVGMRACRSLWVRVHAWVCFCSCVCRRELMEVLGKKENGKWIHLLEQYGQQATDMQE